MHIKLILINLQMVNLKLLKLIILSTDKGTFCFADHFHYKFNLIFSTFHRQNLLARYFLRTVDLVNYDNNTTEEGSKLIVQCIYLFEQIF
jgi:hypothetical protein